jgi:hypothetical protein
LFNRCDYVLTFCFILVIFEEHLLSTTPYDIICYGIGSVQKSKNAQYQFVLALILRELLKVNYIQISLLYHYPISSRKQTNRFQVQCIYLIPL